ncbi:hypothetical protein ACWCXX_40730 [Streptomyces sp. NPDC001732]
MRQPISTRGSFLDQYPQARLGTLCVVGVGFGAATLHLGVAAPLHRLEGALITAAEQEYSNRTEIITPCARCR